jgi:membrane protein
MSILSFTLEELRKINPKNFLKRLYAKAVDEEDLMSAAAQVAFYFAFALFPLLLFLVSLFGIVLESADDMRTEMFFYLRQVMPASAYDLVQKTVEEITQSNPGGKLTFGLLAALWSASAGLDSIRIGLNGVYNLTESRSYWKTKLLSLTLTLGLAILLTIALGVVFFGGKFVSLILNSINLSISSPFFLGVLQTITVLVVLISIFALLYNFLPKHKKSSWVWITPGAIIGIILWLLLSYAFRLYLGYFDSYSKTYGSLGAVIILMLWLYLTALVILIGGSINAVLQEYSDPETAKAGANKAAAKAIIENPDRATALDKKAETLAILNQDSDGKDVPAKSRTVQTIPTDSTADDKPVNKKSAFKLIAGVLIGFISNIRKR